MMKMISNVKKLGITYFGDRYKEDYQLQNLVLLQNLEKLTLIVNKESPLDQQKAKPVFPKTLRKLTLSGWRFPWRYMKAVASLPHLQVLKLKDHACEGDKWDIDEKIDGEESDEESDGEADVFPELEYLLIEESDLKVCVMKKGNFPKLKRLVFNDCDKLSKIPDDVGNIATLGLIEVDRDNTSLVACVQGIREKQKKEYDRTLKIREL
ncbi:putative late blight resistance protein homolog R1B-13 [Salvia miltiorrhiza]|nr:putative late blight resistance protein homolog R1B-13 [Salvia miltiorrhiza]